ncbi:SRPBCC family protein [Nitratireductor soli]|uniref:SRPBCC family protein n=1 Tax=Nitratireductor soli TaxID=1670619 RepID=UPI00065E456B|nr:SRPBCC domain-containing protein [Nitratireductor soli]
MLRPIDLTIERHIRASLATVWDCITRPDLIARWFFATDFKPIVGHRFTIVGEAVAGWRGWTNVEVLELSPPHRMVWSFDCTDAAPPGRVSFRLEEVDDGVRLRLSHEGGAPAPTRQLLDEGWSVYLGQLADLARHRAG